MNAEKNMSAELTAEALYEQFQLDWHDPFMLRKEAFNKALNEYAYPLIEENKKYKSFIDSNVSVIQLQEQTAILQRNWEHEIKNSMELKAENDRLRELLGKAFELHNNLNEAGQIGIGSKWAESFNELTKAINNLTKGSDTVKIK